MIYILSIYAEDGAERVKATTDPEKVIDMLKSYRDDMINPYLSDKNFEVDDGEVEILQKLLKENKLSDGINLANGWGGFMLHIVEDFESRSKS